MTAQILDGKRVAAEITAEIKREIDEQGYKPSLAVVLWGYHNSASNLYVKRKIEACNKVGIRSSLVTPLTDSLSEGHLLDKVRSLNQGPHIDGILVQLPLPEGIDKYKVFDAIHPYKDVDVFSSTNVGLLLQGRPRYLPCTPQGILELLKRYAISTIGKKVCIINRSDVVGKPLYSMLIQNDDLANATVCMCHDHTPPDKLKECCLWADIIIVAVGKPGFLTADLVSKGAVVVDVGITRDVNGKVYGDVDFDAVAEKASWISPVPGGCGPMTISMLLKNTVEAHKMSLSASTQEVSSWQRNNPHLVWHS